jgi:DNA-binding transcriptional regulator YhcF (GntR family)
MTPSPESVAIGELGISIDRRADVPLGVQLAWALRSRIRDGRLKAGQRLPGLRDLADALGVNANTVRSVYQRLEQEEVLESQQGSGTFVTSTPKLPSAVGTIVANAAREAHETGVDPREVAAALYVAPGFHSQPADEVTSRRRQLRNQIAALEQALIEIQAKYPGLAPSFAETSPLRGPRLLDAPELEQIQAKLLRRLASLQAAIDGLTADDPAVSEAPKPASRSHPSKAMATKTRPATAGA